MKLNEESCLHLQMHNLSFKEDPQKGTALARWIPLENWNWTQQVEKHQQALRVIVREARSFENRNDSFSSNATFLLYNGAKF